MKSPSPLPPLFKSEQTEQPIRIIKASAAGKILGAAGHAHSNGASAEPHKKPEIRLIQTGPDYCDLEVVCSCGESTKVRCWNSPATN